MLLYFYCSGRASECLEYARNIAKQQNCYKIILLTGSKNQKTLDFYKNAAYNNTDKTAFIQWF
jgi:DNA-binding MurR/RpiR family transcriptional regulator